jgi:hypothetical protein
VIALIFPVFTMVLNSPKSRGSSRGLTPLRTWQKVVCDDYEKFTEREGRNYKDQAFKELPKGRLR